MATITRIYEDDPGTGGVNFTNTELSLDTQGRELWIGLSTDAASWNNLAEGTLVSIVEGNTEVVVSLGARTFVNLQTVIYPYFLESGTINFTDGASVMASVVTELTVDVEISGTTNIEQGADTVLTARVTDADDNPVEGATVAFSAGQGSFSETSVTTDVNGEASTTYTADFTDPDDVSVTITASAILPANASPKISAPSLTAMTELGITGQILNMFINPTGAVSSSANNVIYQEGGATGTLATGSDDDVTDDIHFWRVRWDNRGSNARLILNDNGAGNPDTFFNSNTIQSVYLIFDDGSYVEITNADYHGGSAGFARWTVTDSDAVDKLNALTSTGMLLIGVADTGSVGFPASAGSDTATVTATAPGGTATAPEAPTVTNITPTATGATVEITAGDNGGQPVTDTEYRIQEGTTIDADAEWVSTGETDTDFEITGLAKGTEHAIEVRQVNAIGNGTASSVSTFTTDTTVPSALRNLVTTPDTISIGIAFDPPADDGGDDITDIEARWNAGSVPTGNWLLAGTTESPITVANLEKGTEYYIQLRPVNSEGAGAHAQVIETTLATVADAPALALSATHNTITATLEAPDDDGGAEIERYDVRIDGGAWIDAGLDLEHVFENLDPDTEYDIDAAAVNPEGRGAIVSETQRTEPEPEPEPIVPMPPVWATGTALRVEIEAGATMTIDIGAKVSGANKIKEIFGVQYQWMEWYEATQILILKDAPTVREDIDIRIRFIAINEDGETPEDYIITLKGSVFASLHNTLFFEEPMNYLFEDRVVRYGTSTLVPELSDNDYAIFTRHTDFNFNIADADGNPTIFDYIFIKAKGQNIVYSVTLTGGTGNNLTNRAIPETIKNIGGGEVSTIVNGFTHELYPLSEPVTATDVRLQISGTNLEIYAVMFLKIFWEINANSEYVQMAFEKVDRAGEVIPAPDGSIERGQVLGAERQKWEAEYTAIVAGSDVDEFMDKVEANMNCAFAREFSRHPADVYPAFFPAFEMPTGYLGLVKSIGETIQFGVFEQ